MRRIGFICDIREGSNPVKIVGSARLQRAVPMNDVLRESGVELFAYSRWHVNPETRMAFGYCIRDRGFVPVVAPVPIVNGNWCFGMKAARNRSRMNLKRFHEWARRNRIEIYPPADFARLTLDKYMTFRLVSDLDHTLHPYTEEYAGSERQLQQFLDRTETVFLKPRFGSQGDRVIVLKRGRDGVSLAMYAGKRRETSTCPSLRELRRAVDLLVGETPYVIQAAVDVKRHEGAAFIVRAIMVSDGRAWNWTPKLVMATACGDVANTTQGGTNHTLEEALPKIFGHDADRVTEDLRRVSFQLAAYLETLYPDMIMELAFDFLMDKTGTVFLGELDVQPGLVRPGMDPDRPFRDIFDIQPDERPLYDKYVVPHASCLARFLHSKLERRLAEGL